jgi:hypothetical protein
MHLLGSARSSYDVKKVHRASRPTAVTDQTDASAPRQEVPRCVFGISQEARRALEAPTSGRVSMQQDPPYTHGSKWAWGGGRGGRLNRFTAAPIINLVT